MIKIELQFTSVAEAAVFLAGRAAPTATTVSADVAKPEKAVVKAEPEKAKAEGKAQTQKQVSPPAAADSSPPATDAASSASSTGATPSAAATVADVIDYAVLQKAVFTLAGKSRDAAAGVAASFGVKTFKELDPSRWAEALEAVNAAIEVA